MGLLEGGIYLITQLMDRGEGSGTHHVERVFSLSSQGMDDNQRRALENYMCGSVLVRYNRIWMDKDNL